MILNEINIYRTKRDIQNASQLSLQRKLEKNINFDEVIEEKQHESQDGRLSRESSKANANIMRNASSKRLFLDLSVKIPMKKIESVKIKGSSMSINIEPQLIKKKSETLKEKQLKFEELMQGGKNVQKELEGLNTRFDNGLGKGVQFYKA